MIIRSTGQALTQTDPILQGPGGLLPPPKACQMTLLLHVTWYYDKPAMSRRLLYLIR